MYVIIWNVLSNPQCVIEKHSCPKCISHKCITSYFLFICL